MTRAISVCAVLAAILVIQHTTPVYADFIKVNPRATYLRTNADTALNTVPIDLSTLSFAVNPGDFIQLERIGDYGFSGGDGSGTAQAAVFSSTSILLSSSNLNRVSGAIEAGVDYVTPPTFWGSVSTDISQDFFVYGAGGIQTSVIIQVPVGANYLFVSAIDSLFGDNGDSDNDYGIQITAVPTVVPEPGSIAALLSLTACGAAVVIRRRRQSAK